MSLVALKVLIALTLQVFAVSVWILADQAAAGTVFSGVAFRYVNTVIGAIVTAAFLLGVLGVIVAPEEVPPGVVALIGGAALVLIGIAVLVGVMKQLLRQAIAMRDELDQVV